MEENKKTILKINGQQDNRFEDVPENIRQSLQVTSLEELKSKIPTLQSTDNSMFVIDKNAVGHINLFLKATVYIMGLVESQAFRMSPLIGSSHTPLPVSLISSIGVAWLANKLSTRKLDQMSKQPLGSTALNLFTSMGFDKSIITTLQANTFNVFINFFVAIVEESIFKNLGF